LVFFLQTARVAQASDVASLPYSNELIPGSKAWVDDDGTGHWVVLEKQEQFAIKVTQW
jgi:pimeloyl-ACP methyl ester carboxylesterase